MAVSKSECFGASCAPSPERRHTGNPCSNGAVGNMVCCTRYSWRKSDESRNRSWTCRRARSGLTQNANTNESIESRIHAFLVRGNGRPTAVSRAMVSERGKPLAGGRTGACTLKQPAGVAALIALLNATGWRDHFRKLRDVACSGSVRILSIASRQPVFCGRQARKRSGRGLCAAQGLEPRRSRALVGAESGVLNPIN